MKEFVVSLFYPNEIGCRSSTVFTIASSSRDLAIRNFWALEGGGTYENEDYEGAVTIYDLKAKRVVYRYGCGR